MPSDRPRKSKLVGAGWVLLLVAVVSPTPLAWASGAATSYWIRLGFAVLSDLARVCFFVAIGCFAIGLLRNRRWSEEAELAEGSRASVVPPSRDGGSIRTPHRYLWRSVAIVVLAGAATVVGWYLFRTTTEDNPGIGIIRLHRFFGRVTRVTIDADRDGRIDGEVSFHWGEPLPEVTDVPIPYDEMRMDRNRDGVWDTWVYRAGDSSGPRSQRVTLAVDLDGDGKPDREFEIDSLVEGLERAKDVRGY